MYVVYSRCISCTPDDITVDNVLMMEYADDMVLDGATTGISCLLCTCLWLMSTREKSGLVQKNRYLYSNR
jgi:hypothetical protein